MTLGGADQAREQVAAEVLKRLARAAPEDEIVYSVCKMTGWGWDEALEFMRLVAQEHPAEIAARQIALKSVLAVVFALLGAGMIVGPLVYLVNMLDVTGAFAAFLASWFNGGLDTAFELVRQRCLLLGWLELPGIIFTMAAGAAILYGNIRYARDAWLTLFRRIALIE